MTDYRSYSPEKAFSRQYQTKHPPQYTEHRDATFNTTLSPYQTPNRDTYSKAYDETDVSEHYSGLKARHDNQTNDLKRDLNGKYNRITFIKSKT